MSASALLVLGALAGLGLVEGVLAALGFRAGSAYAQGWSMDDEAARYVPRPGFYHGLFGADVRIDSLGLRGPELRRADVLVLGDSCSFGEDVPERKTFAGRLGARGLVVANAAVPGYNSTLGLARLKSSALLSLQPRAVVILFGWNDHRLAAAPESAFAALRFWARRFRTAALLLRFQESLFQARTFWGRWRLVPQVPLGEFERNLREMIALSRAAGAVPILVTAASDPTFSGSGDAPIVIDYRRYHARYAEAVRRVAAETGTPLVDLEREVAALDDAARDPLFEDFVHFNEKGHALAARELGKTLTDLGIGRPRKGDYSILRASSR